MLLKNSIIYLYSKNLTYKYTNQIRPKLLGMKTEMKLGAAVLAFILFFAGAETNTKTLE